MGRVTPGLVALGVLASFGCHDTIGPGQDGARFLIQDAGHNGGNAHFYWSAPIVADPGRGGEFDPTYQPMVQICEWTGSSCARTVAEFRTGAGNGDAIRVDAAGELYHVNWHTSHCRREGCPLNPAKTYRIRVLVGGLEAGVADVDLLSKRSEVRSVHHATYVPVVNGTTLQIRFRLEHGLRLVNASAAALPELRRTGQRYRNAGVKPGTGRDGSAVVEGRALIGADGTTLIELTTGRLDQPGSAGLGNFEKVQLKQMGASGAPVYTLNFTDLSGSAWSHALQPLPRRSQLEVTAHVSGIDASRTNVVTVPLTVGRRPDLAITSLAVPSSATAGVPTVIRALVAEQNGDVGASGDCRLYVNDTLADEAPSIWVDAGDEVACTFAHTFAQAGTYDVRVAIVQVAPADDDAGNNNASGVVAVTLLDNITIRNTAQAAVTEHDHYREAFSYLLRYTRLDDASYLDLEEGGWERETHGRSVTAQHAWTADNGAQGNEITFPLASVKVVQRSGDAVIADYTLTNVSATSTASWDYVDAGGRHWGHSTCYRAAAPSGQVGWLRICTDVTNDEPIGQPVQRGSRTYGHIEAVRGHVQYLGRVFYHRVFTPYEEDYGYDAPWLEEQIDGGSVGALGAEMSWSMEVNGVRAGNGQAIVYNAQLAAPWTLTDSQTFDGTEQCASTGTVIGMTVEESRQCYVQSGAYRALNVSRPLTP